MGGKFARTLIRLGISLGAMVLFLAHTSGFLTSRLLTTLENVTYDSRVLLTMPETVDPRVVILDMDEKSLAAEGWPMPRDKLARLMTQLFDKYRIRVLGFDMVFAEPDRTSGLERLDELAAGKFADLPGFAERIGGLRESLDHDREFAGSLRARPAVMGYVFAFRGDSKGALGPVLMPKADASVYSVTFIDRAAYTGNLPMLQEATAYGGFFDNDATLDEDGIIRRVPLMQRYEGALYPSLALEVARVALGYPRAQLEFEPAEARGSLNLERVRLGERTVPVDEVVSVMVPYRGRQGSFPYVPMTDVLHGTADPKVLENAIVLFGTTAAGLKDIRTTPVGNAYAGVEVHANIISGILDGRMKHRAPYYAGMETSLLLVIGLLMAWLFPKVSPLWAFGMALAIVGSLTSLAFWAWNSGNLVMPLGVPVVFTLVLFLAHVLYGYFVETRRAQGISRQFGEYVPPEIVAEMAEQAGSVSMEGEIREMTVMFSDVRGFTTISEQLDAKALSDMMNQFLTPETQIIQKHRGTIDKYMGDAIMAFWGAPLPDSDHASNALKAALDMVKAVRDLDEPFQKRGWPPIQIGVGVTTGTMRVGNMGSEFRKAYTVMGDPVNLGSRVEGLTKEYGAKIICTEFTRNAGPSDWSYRELDLVKVKGKDKPVAIYEPLGPKDALAADLRNEVARHRGALKMYRAQQWEQAEAEFFSLSRGAHPQKVYELFLERIAHFRKNPPGAAWDGVFTFTTK